MMYKHAIPFTTNPTAPLIQNHPGSMPDLLLNRCGRIAAKYERLESTTKDPTNALNAVEEPRYIHPGSVAITPQKRTALNGFLNLVLTLPNMPAKGVALSLASVQNTRLAVI